MVPRGWAGRMVSECVWQFSAWGCRWLRGTPCQTPLPDTPRHPSEPRSLCPSSWECHSEPWHAWAEQQCQPTGVMGLTRELTIVWLSASPKDSLSHVENKVSPVHTTKVRINVLLQFSALRNEVVMKVNTFYLLSSISPICSCQAGLLPTERICAAHWNLLLLVCWVYLHVNIKDLIFHKLLSQSYCTSTFRLLRVLWLWAGAEGRQWPWTDAGETEHDGWMSDIVHWLFCNFRQNQIKSNSVIQL